ncbi:MAG: potassium transporter KtrB [Planctomycetes bacterium]|nr:potassium transporter KtrB [Planctomycetota bacterium]
MVASTTGEPARTGVRAFVARLHPTALVLLGYLWYIAAGWLLLCLPLCQKGPGAGPLDNLFIAASAVSTTGLTTVSVADSYSLPGQLVVLALIQLGGVGYMTLGSFFTLSRRNGLSPVRLGIGRAVFSLPDSFRLDKFIRSVIRFTFAIELCGALALYPLFRRAGVDAPLWNAVFHSVSAFCTAGFGLSNTSFEAFAADPWMNGVLAALSYLGAVGFIVVVDFARMITGKIEQVTLTTKIILWATLWMTVVGTALLFLGEPTLRELPPEERLLAAFFQCMTAMTTVGFNTVPIGALSKASLLVVIVLMVIGSSPSGTGGGLKCTTVTAILGVMRGAARGEREARFWGRAIPLDRVWMAVATLGFYCATLVAGVYLLELTQPTPFESNFFEAASALGTVGLSTGITPGLTGLGKLIVIALMFCGRVGPLTLGTALFSSIPGRPRTQDGDLAV